MKLKITQNPVIEKANPLPDTFDLHLLGTEALYEYAPDMEFNKDAFNSNNCSFYNNFGTSNRFYYRIEKLRNNTVEDLEFGIGCLIKENDIIFLRRLQPFIHQYQNNPPQQCFEPCYNFRYCSPGEYIVAKAHVPSTPGELLIDPYSIIASQSIGLPSVVNMKNNSLLARTDEGIVSLKTSDLSSLEGFSESTKTALCDYTKQLILSTTQLYAKKLKTEQLQFSPCNISNAKEGTLIYNKEDKTLCYYTGEKWRVLDWHEEA